MTSVSTDRRFGVNSGAAVKVPVKAATTAAITLSGEQTIDGVSCVTDDRVLVKDQASAVANGIYTVDTGAWSRARDFDANYDVVEGTFVHVNQGTTNGESMWRVATSGTITIDTTSISFERCLVNESSSISFNPTGIGAISGTVAGALGLTVHTSQFATAGNYQTARDALTGTLGVPGLDVTGALDVVGATTLDGNVTLGNASGDSLTVNASAWTLGSNVVATRVAGTVATSSVQLFDIPTTFTGDSGGGSDVSALRVNHSSDGANAVEQSIAGRFTSAVTGSGAVTTLRGVLGECRLDGSGDVSGALCLSANFVLSSTGSITTNVQMIRVPSPTITGAGTVPEIEGMRISDLGHANITTVTGIRILDQTTSTNLTGIRSSISAGTGKINLNIDGTAINFLAGSTGIVGTPSPSTCLALGLGTTARSSLRIPHGDAPTSPVNGDIWTTTSGLFVRINGSTVGPLS